MNNGLDSIRRKGWWFSDTMHCRPSLGGRWWTAPTVIDEEWFIICFEWDKQCPSQKVFLLLVSQIFPRMRKSGEIFSILVRNISWRKTWLKGMRLNQKLHTINHVRSSDLEQSDRFVEVENPSKQRFLWLVYGVRSQVFCRGARFKLKIREAINLIRNH